MVNEVREVQPEKVSSPMKVTEEGMLTEDTPLQPWKFRVPPDMTGLEDDVHPGKACTPMEVTEEGMATEAREEQPAKAPAPMDVTEEGMATEIREVQPWKA